MFTHCWCGQHWSGIGPSPPPRHHQLLEITAFTLPLRLFTSICGPLSPSTHNSGHRSASSMNKTRAPFPRIQMPCTDTPDCNTSRLVSFTGIRVNVTDTWQRGEKNLEVAIAYIQGTLISFLLLLLWNIDWICVEIYNKDNVDFTSGMKNSSLVHGEDSNSFLLRDYHEHRIKSFLSLTVWSNDEKGSNYYCS